MANSLDIIKSRRGSGTSLASVNNNSSALSILKSRKSSSAQPTLTPVAQRYAANNTSSAASKNGPSGTPVTNGQSGTPVPTGGSSKNRGGLLGGIGYVGEKIGLGFMQGLEGVVDYVGAGIAELFGNDEASERIISNDWMNYSHADEWFNPGEGWRIAGDVGGGIGTSLPGLAAGVAVTWATGGSGIGAGIGLALSGFSAAGTSTKEAYLESGELGGKEFGYGAAMGVVEAATEKLSGSLGKGLLRGIDDIAGAFGKTASKTAKALTVKTVAKDLGGEFLSEAFEEGFAEFVSPYAKRLTYDPNAKNATIEEISYAALVGGLSGLAMGGGRVGVTQLGHNVQGNKAVDAGRVTSIMDTAKAFSDYEGEHPTKLSSLEAIRDLYTRLDAQGVRTATELTGNQRRALGELQALTTTAVFEPAMQKSALSAIAGADAIAEKLNADGNVKIVDGKMQVVTSDILAELQKKGTEVRDITAEDIRGGVDVKSGKSIREALKKKDVLRYVVASDVAGRFLMTAKEVETAARAGTKIKSQADLNAFIENASEEKKHALGAELGIADNEWATLKLKRFNEAAAAYRESGKLDAKRAEMQAQKEKASAVAQTPSDVAKPLKTAKNTALTSTDQGNVSVSGEISPGARMSMDEITDNPSVAGGDTSLYTKEADAAKPTKEKVAALKERLDAKKIDSYAAENIEGYSSLGEANKSMIRQVVREGRANGLDDADVLTSARVAARTGLNIEYDTNTEDGVAGYYDPRANKIVVNPKAGKRQELVLIHELDHALRAFRGNDGKVHYLVYKDADKRLSDETWSAIQQEYADQDIEVSREELLADEASAYYTEAILGGKGTVDLLLGKEPSLAKKILNFFTAAARAYSKDAKLAKEARRHYKSFKAMFDAFAERNKGRNAETAVESVGDGKAKRKTYASVKAKTADKMQLSNARQMLENGASSEEVRKATGWFRGYDGKWRFEISDVDSHLIENPALKKHTDDGEVYFTGKLSDIFDHNALYAAYPELKDINVVIQKTELGVDGIYQPKSNYITLSIEQFKRHTKAYHDYLDGGRRAEIKSIEATDAYKEYNRLYDDAVMDEMDPTEWLEAEKTAREKFYSSELGKRYYQLMWGKDGFSGDKFEFGWAKPAKETLLHELQHAVQNIEGLASGTNTRDPDYDRNAGEIEARDTARRANMTAEERKNTRPDIDREDVVVADRSAVSYFAKDSKNDEIASIRKQMIEHLDEINKMEPVANIRYSVIDKEIAKKDALSLYKTKGLKVDRQNFGTIELGEKEIKESSNYVNTSAESAAWMTIPNVLKRGKIVSGHEDHKSEGFPTYTIVAPVIINGKRGNVGAVVKKTGKYRYKAHRIIMPDGSVFVFEDINKNAEPTGSDILIRNNEKGPDISSASMNSISQSEKKSTASAKKVSENSDKISKSARKSVDFEAKLADESGIEKSIGKLNEGKIESIAGRDAKAGARRAAAYSRRRQDMTVGQLRQMVARYTGEKVYTSKEARETIDNIWGIFTLSGKNRAKLYEALWQGYNSCKTDNERAEFSYDMAEYITVMMLAESSVANPDKPGALETLSELKSGIGHLTFNDSQRADLRHALDKAGYKKFIGRWGFRETMQPNRRRIAVDVFIHNLAEENPEFAYLQEKTPQDAILELDRVYERTIEESKATVGVLDDMPDAELRGMIDDIGMAIYESFRTKGEKSTAAKVVEAKIASTERKYSKLKEKYDELERKYYEEQGRPRKLRNLSYQIQKMKDLRLGTFLNATDFKNEVFKQTFEILGTIEFRGDISPKKVRLAMKRLAEWYKAENPVLKDMDGVPGSGYYSEFTALLINNIAEGEGGLSMFELNALDNILRHATHIVENFNRVWKGGKWVKADSTAKGFVEVADSARNLRSSADMRKISRLFDNVGKKYLTAFGDPMTLFRYMDGYQDGFFTWAGEELRAGAFRHGVDVMEMKADYDAFLEGKSHKGYVKKASKDAVEYGGVKMSKLHYISLYMTMQRQQAQRGLAENGFSLIDVTGQRVEVDGFLSRGQERLGRELGIKKSPDGAWKISDEQMKAAVESEISMMKKKLTDEDLEFIGIIERTLNGKCKELKSSRDMERLGYSNTISGYYYPIVRAMIAKTIDSQGMWGELDRASNISANKDTVKGAAGALWIESADTVFNRHIDAVARYAELSPAIDAINKIFNLDISGNKNKPRSVRTATFNSWQTSKLFGGAPSDVQRHNGEAYLKDLLADLQGIGKNAGIGEKFAEGLRGGFAISALAANPKVLMTQLSSVLASTNILSMKSVSTGMKLGFGNGVGEDMDVYCPVAKLRNYDSSAAKAQGVIENVRGVGEKLMTLVSAMDRGVVRMLWGACQVEVESTKGHKIGTEENKVEAGKLLERVIQETQQNSIATEKSAAMRSKSMLMKSLTMFTSDAMKSVGRVIDAFGHLASLDARIKAAEARGDAETAKTLEGEREGVMKQARKSVGALVLTSVYMTLIARAFSWLYAKDEEEERPVLAFIADVFGGMLGGLPIISDIYDFFSNGYEISDNVYDSLNDVLTGVKKIIDTSGRAMNGEATATDVNGSLLSGMQAICTAAGIPMRNIRNMVMGLTRRFNPNAAYRMEMLTKSKNFASDFEEAVEAGDDDKAMMILGLLLEERLGTDGERTVGDADNPSVAGGDTSLYTREALRMSKAGYNILPRTIGSTVTIAGEEVDMTPEEQTALRARYSEATGHIEALVGSAEYAALSDEQKESAIRFIYDAYYDVGIAELYGYERNLKRRLFSRVISVEKLALANVVTAGLESDHEDGRGKAVSSEAWAKIRGTAARVNYSTVQGSKRKKVIAAINKLPLTTAEKLLIIAYKGYTVKDGDIRGVSAARAKQMLSRYARGQGLSKDEARALEEYL